MLFLTFSKGLEETPFAYASYVLSAYALVIACAYIAGGLRGNWKALLHRNRYVHRYLTDIPFRTHVSLYMSLAVNLAFAAVKLFFGVRCRSVWFGTLAVYYIMLSLLRFLLLHSVRRNGIGTELVSEWLRYRLCGIILLLMNIVLAGVVILVVRKDEGFRYAGYLIYVAAMYAFYNVITAVRDVVKYRRYNSPVMAAAKTVKLAAALVSMLALETAMLARFNEEKGSAFQQVMTGVTGGCVCLLVLAIASAMIVRSAKQLKGLRDSGLETSEREEFR
ncbi:MAG: hypothetical protein Q4C45_00975 [Oscillospiraceae bacterium]|nr:hypothetical protein [Oscillospiraceae bacterium]